MSWTFELLMKPPRGTPLTEGPVWDGEQLLFTHIQASTILRLDVSTGVITPWRTGTNRTNGLAVDSAGRLFGCCSGGRSLLRFEGTSVSGGIDTVVTDRIDGKRLNTPNDLAIDRKGRIWFSNPINAGNWDTTEQTELPSKPSSRNATRTTAGDAPRRPASREATPRASGSSATKRRVDDMSVRSFAGFVRSRHPGHHGYAVPDNRGWPVYRIPGCSIKVMT